MWGSPLKLLLPNPTMRTCIGLNILIETFSDDSDGPFDSGSK